jgi:hypothetical protein
MAYPNLCPGGYPVPEFDGVREIVGINFSPTTVGSQVNITLRDANNYTYDNDPELNKHEVIKVLADGNQSYFQMFPVPIKVRRGIRATTLTNATRVILYVR